MRCARLEGLGGWVWGRKVGVCWVGRGGGAMVHAHMPPCIRTSLWAGVSIQSQTAAARRLRSGLLTWRAHQPMRSGVMPTTMSCAAVQCVAVQCVMVQRYGGRYMARGTVEAGGGSWELGARLHVLCGHLGGPRAVCIQRSIVVHWALRTADFVPLFIHLTQSQSHEFCHLITLPVKSRTTAPHTYTDPHPSNAPLTLHPSRCTSHWHLARASRSSVPPPSTLP
jgi:hypothetical protein